MAAPFVRLSKNCLLNISTITRIQLNDEKKTAEVFVSTQQIMLTDEESKKLYEFISGAAASGWVRWGTG
jgi:hypothetical protein